MPLPRTLSAIGERHRFLAQDGWRIYSPRYAPPPSLAGHLTFALKHEGIDLAVLKRLYAASGPAPVEALVRAAPTGAYARRLWFLYEWLTGRRLDLPNADRGAYRAALEDYSTRLLPAVDWRVTAGGNVAVLNDTADFYRFFDATPHAEFLYRCVQDTIERHLPDEAEFLRRHDARFAPD